MKLLSQLHLFCSADGTTLHYTPDEKEERRDMHATSWKAGNYLPISPSPQAQQLTCGNKP